MMPKLLNKKTLWRFKDEPYIMKQIQRDYKNALRKTKELMLKCDTYNEEFVLHHHGEYPLDTAS